MKKLFSRNKTEQTEAPGNDNKSMDVGGISLARINLLALAVVVLIVLISGYAAYLQYASLITSRQEDNRQAQAERMAALLSGRLMALNDEMERLSLADDDLLSAIEQADLPTLRQREAAIHANFPSAMRVRYILPGDDQPDDSLTPPLSYACLELARIAEQGKSYPPFEVHLFGGEVEHLDLVRPIADGETVVASLMVTLDVETLKKWVKELRPDGGYVELQQGVDGDFLRLFGQGDSSVKRGDGFRAEVEGSSWVMFFWPSGRMGVAEARIAGFVVTFAVAAALVIAFFIFYGLFISSFVRTDMKRMVNFIVDSTLGKRYHSYPVKLAEAKKVLQDKETDLAVLSSYTNTSESIHDKAEHFVPDISFSGDSGISVEEVNEPAPKKDDQQ